MEQIEGTPRTRLRRHPERAVDDMATAHAILDEALVCHVGLVDQRGPVVIPTIYARIDETLYLHGSQASQLLRSAKEGIDVCVTVTLLDGLVLARSWFNHSMNYRSVVAFGRARAVTAPHEKAQALQAMMEHVVTGRSEEARPPNARELAATLVIALPLDEVSVKVRTGGPVDDATDLGRSVWAGVVPMALAVDAPEPDPHTPPGAVPPSVER